MAELEAREMYHFVGNNVWVDVVTVVHPNEVRFSINVPVPNPNLEGDIKADIEKNVKTQLNNAIVRIGRMEKGKGRPAVSKERKLVPGSWLEKEHNASRRRNEA